MMIEFPELEELIPRAELVPQCSTSQNRMTALPADAQQDPFWFRKELFYETLKRVLCETSRNKPFFDHQSNSLPVLKSVPFISCQTRQSIIKNKFIYFIEKKHIFECKSLVDLRIIKSRTNLIESHSIIEKGNSVFL
jgi:hypothetical protein